MILITGATGNIGSEVLRILAEEGADLRAVSRNPPESSNPRVEWVKADLADREALPGLLDGVQKLFLLTGNVGNMVRLQRNAIRASEDGSVKHVVKVSALGASDHSKSVIGVWHYVVESTLRESGLDWTILRPHVFMQNLLDQKEGIIGEGCIRSPSADAEIPMIDTRDVAAVAAGCLTGDRHIGQTYTLSGPEPVSYAEAARVLGSALERELMYVAESEPEAFERLHAKGEAPWLIGAQLALAEYQRAGGGTDIVTDTVEQITGHAPRSIRDFARDYAEAFTA